MIKFETISKNVFDNERYVENLLDHDYKREIVDCYLIYRYHSGLVLINKLSVDEYIGLDGDYHSSEPKYYMAKDALNISANDIVKEIP